MSMLDSVSGLIECAKRLRGVAEALDAADLKAQIVEELLRLHEIRDGLSAPAEHSRPDAPELDAAAPRAESAVGRVTAEPRKLLIDGDAKTFTFDADEVTETYSLHLYSPDQPAPAAPPATAAVADAPETAAAAAPAPAGSNGDPADAPTTASQNNTRPPQAEHRGKPPADAADSAVLNGTDAAERPADGAGGGRFAALSEQERFALAEQRIFELEPLHQAALRKMNDLLTDEQRRIKAEATRAGMKAGRKGRELQQSVMAALNLTTAQQQRMAAARKELLDVRQAIARQVEGLLSKEQLERMLQQFAKKHGS